MSDTTKDTNPKDAIGCTKLPLSLVPATAIGLCSLALLNGKLKYGQANWRIAGVRASIYLDALRRHVSAWENGEECDPDDGVPHLAAALACLVILVDARACGKLTDDRPPSVPLPEFFRALTPHVERLKTLHADRNPRHWTIADSGLPCPPAPEIRKRPGAGRIWGLLSMAGRRDNVSEGAVGSRDVMAVECTTCGRMVRAWLDDVENDELWPTIRDEFRTYLKHDCRLPATNPGGAA